MDQPRWIGRDGPGTADQPGLGGSGAVDRRGRGGTYASAPTTRIPISAANTPARSSSCAGLI
ncbi:hypothetical protein, partial [Streptomyces apricus]|uniref:hypothetical protein n=1 Tax=Streptomyces apricus TaxID=1828112 RepID=UPI001CAA8872